MVVEYEQYQMQQDFQFALDVHRRWNGAAFDFRTRVVEDDPPEEQADGDAHTPDDDDEIETELPPQVKIRRPRTVITENVSVHRRLTSRELETWECEICLSADLHLLQRECCMFIVCLDCICQYIRLEISEARIKPECPNSACNITIEEEEILSHLDSPGRSKYWQFSVDAARRPDQKTCPKCGWIRNIDVLPNLPKKLLLYGLRVECQRCRHLWCFVCQSPWHTTGEICPKDNCKDSERLLKRWAGKKLLHGRTAVQCPKCRAWIEKNGGCNHINCKMCKKDFCYKCKGDWKYKHLCRPVIDKITFHDESSTKGLRMPLIIRKMSGYLHQRKLQKLIQESPRKVSTFEDRPKLVRESSRNLTSPNVTVEDRTELSVDREPSTVTHYFLEVTEQNRLGSQTRFSQIVSGLSTDMIF